MKKIQISFCTNLKIKNGAQRVAQILGLPLSTLLNMCLYQTVYQQQIPFSTAVPKSLRYKNTNESNYNSFNKDV